ncbi:MqnA/MqnD/SBP family protein [Alistipes sp.]|uniref:MqnA/MqnD/SBP family protein n=1 Tax=Alistipes sp. TaxID=1872444 RepID=UPI0025BA17CC|nr:MqnA/MqnD/SBP family protein [Alistipes sp.]
MMVIVPRIAAVSCLSTTPFIYGIRHEGNLRAELLLSDPDTVIQDFLEHKADIALIPFTAVPLLADARTVTEYCVGGVAAEREALLASDDPLVGIWKEQCGELPFAFAVWVARADTDPDTIEALQYALTYGLERGYEAMMEASPELDPLRAYEALSGFDYIFDNEKNQALQQFWDAGIKVAPRANPG